MDSNFTPQLLINADHPGVSIPFDRIQMKDSELVLNVHEQAVDGFYYQDDEILFKTRFSGQPFEVAIPFDAVIAVFTRETHEGLHLRSISRAEQSAEIDENATETPSDESSASSLGKPHLTVVK